PEAMAVVGEGGEEWSYGRLEETSNRLARHLVRLGVGVGSAVGISLERSPELILGMLAILKAGGAYVPLDAGYPDERLAFMLADTGAQWTLVQAATRERLAALTSVVPIENGAWQEESAEPLAVRMPAASLAYVIYTSGSTGRPKGVAVPHRAIARLVRETNFAPLGPEDRVGHASNISFDAATFEIWGALLNGGAVVVIGKEVALSPSELALKLRAERITTLFLTTALFNQVAREEPSAFRPLRHLLFGGEAVDPGSVARVLAEGAPERLLHVYGPTESTTYATWYRVHEVAAGATTVPIGEPLANTTGDVLDAWQGLSALGEVGELYLGGEGLAWGYLHRPELTAERFVPHPWSGEAGERLYRTGDLVRRRFDGAIEFVGRVDHQVKIRGFRIELGEIEADLTALPGVADCVVLARRDQPGDARLVAYVVPTAGASLDESSLRAGLQHALPDYMLPSVFILLEALPLTPNGKLDRAALPAPGQGGREDGYVAPRDPVEGVLAGIWEEVLGRERVSVEEDFFALGGHSLLATQVMSRVRGAFQVELPLRQLFEGPTIAQLACAVSAASAARQGGVSAVAPPIVPTPRDRDLQLSFAQQRLWFLDQLEPGNPAYNVPWAARLLTEIDALDVHLLRRIFAAVVRRHEALRTTFSSSNRGPVQTVQADLAVPVPVVSLEGLAEAAQPSEIRRLAVAEARRSFDLSRGPLLRLTLLRLSAREHVLLVTMHHIVSDGWSMGVLLREVMALYAASPLPELPIQYADFAVWQRAWLSGEVLEAQLSYWREQLAGASHLLELATDRPRPASPTHRAGLARLDLDRQVAAALAVFSRSEGVTLYMTLLAALGVLLGRSAHQEEVLVGSPIANRTHRDTEGLIGFFVNTLVLRVDLQAAPSGRELLGRVRQAALDAYAHQDLPFERLVEEVVPERNLGHSPLFQVMFALQNAPVERLSVPGLTLLPLAPEPGVAKFDLTLTFEETPAGLSGLAEYDAEIFDATSIERLLARFTPLLAATMDDPERPVGELPLLLSGEREQLVCEWNDTWSDYPRELSVHALFAAQAEATPGALAVVEGEEEWSYGRLAAAAYRLAWHLRSLGVSQESRVGVALERSAELIVAFLGVLAAGGVYVPLDPGYPDERLRFMLEDTGASVVLVHGRTRERLESLAVSTSLVCLDRDREAMESWSPAPPPDWTAAEQLAYVIYTSGSTGRPKGVAVAHRAIVRLVRETNFVQLGPEDRVAHASNISFDAATFEIWGALLNGGAVVVMERQVVLSPAALAARLREAGVTAMFLTTALFNQVVREEPGAFYPLRHLLFGGEAVDPGAAARALAEGAPERLLHVYGPTESTTYATWHEVREVAPGAATVPIGLPLANTTLYLLVPDLELAPLGQLGELCIGGEGLARGYLNRPELTAERFVPDLWSREPGGRLYRTGDRVRRLGDGAIEFVGRLDQQVKIRGFRIEPGEIEAVLAGCPGVEACVVLARRDTPGTPGMPGNTRLVAYLVAKPGERLEEAGVREYLKRSLPEYMLPAAYLFLAALPLTPNGKVDRASLPAPDGVERRADGYVAPRGPVEGLLVGIWEEVLGRERVGVTDDFFALGGHSLLATQVASRVRQAFGVELPLHDLFDRPTIASLAADLDRLLRGTERADLPAVPPLLPLPPELREPPPALSFAQQRLWFLDQLAPGDPTYNLSWAARLRGDLAVGLLRRVFGEVVRRHEALRTTFADTGQDPVQVIAAPRPVPLPVVSLAGLSEETQQDEVRRLATAAALRPFDLSAGPLLRLALLGLAAREHVLLVTMHHIVADGWSMGVLFQEIGALYDAFSRGEGSPLPELPIQYADFAAWQRGWLAGEVLEEQLTYWRRQLAGAPPRLELPFDRPRPPAPRHRGGLRPARLDGELARDLAAFCRHEDVTPFMTLLAAFGVLLGRQANQSEVLVGSPIANRTHREIEGLIGFFVNTLVLRVPLGSFGSRPSFRDLLGRVRQVALDAYTHQDLPFERLVEEVATDRRDRGARDARGPARSPLFQVMFALQNAPAEGAALPGLTLDLLPLEGGVARADLSLLFYDSPQGISGLLEYDADLFDRTTAERLLGRYEGLLRGALAAPDRVLWDLPLLLPGEREQVLREWNDTRSEYSRESSVPARFAVRVRERPEAPAILGGEEEWSYGRLDEATNRLAWYLRSLGVGAESRVGVAMERSAELIVAFLAILKAGGTYVPLDTGYPDERLRFLLADTGASVALVHGRTRERLAALGSAVSLVCLDGDREAIARWSAAAPPGLPLSGIAAEQLAYITYTSGSTGQPKGVATPHRAIVRLVEGTDYVRLGPADRVAHAANISFDAATFEIWGALLGGGAVVVIEREVVLRPAALSARLREMGVTALFLTTALFNQVVREEPAAFGALSHLLFGGEAVDPGAVARALAAGAPERLLHVYGPTESTTFAAWHEVRQVAPGAGTVPIGLPLANTALYVLDPWGEPAPRGQVGELYVGGEGLARGYLHRPDLTAERFVPDPWSGEAGGRLYRTGDLVRRRWDGAIEFVGRADHQVKIRGFRIEPGEIEAALAGCPGVEAGVVLARRDTPPHLRLVAYLVAKPGERLAEGEVREFLKRSLPDYMVPSVYLFLKALPLTPNGKVDRAALPAPAAEGAEPGADFYLAPRGPVETLLVGIWEEILGRERVGVEDDFFALGGHSLLATQLASRVRQTFGVELPLHDLFLRPTIAGLAAELDRRLHRAERAAVPAAPPLLPLTPELRAQPLPLSFAQQRLWFLYQLAPGDPAYNMPWAMRVTGDLDIDVLRQVFGEVVRRHEALRTTFLDSARGPAQVLAGRQPVSLPVVSLEDLPEGAREAVALRLATAEGLRPFDLAVGPLLRLLLVRLHPREHVLLMVMHHIVSDGWSMGVLVREIGVLYPAFLRGESSPLPALPVQYADFAVWQRSWLSGETLAAQLDYWRRQLDGAPRTLELPTDRPRPAVPGRRGQRQPLALAAKLSQEVATFSRREDVTPFMLLLAIFGILLARSANQPEVLVGSPIANRTHRDAERLIGFFVNTLVLRVPLGPADRRPSFRDLLGRVRQMALDAYTHQDLPFERVVEEVVDERRDRGYGHSPLFQVMFGLQNAPVEALELPGLTLRLLPVEDGLARFDLALMLFEAGAGLAGGLEYDIELFDRTTVERLLGRYAGLLQGAMTAPDQAIWDLPFLLPGEREQLLREWNDTWSEYPRGASVHALFSAWARERPAATAVVDEGREWSYGELAAAANRLAWHLRSLGVGRESLVGVSMERSADLIVAFLGILQAGGAYVPLDPGYPDERLAFMLADTAARVVLVHGRTRERLAGLAASRDPSPWRRVCLDQDREAIARWSPAALTERTLPAELAHVIYTSGSTGRPKGVAILHQGIVRLVRGTNFVQLRPEDRLAHASNISFDAATYEIWGTLLNGCALVVVSRNVALSPPALARLLSEQRVTVMMMATALFHQVLREEPLAFRSLRHLVIGGEALDPVVISRVLREGAPERLINGYGPAENTTAATWHEVGGLAPGAWTVPIGLPIANTTAHVLDPRGEPAALGQLGEVHLGGDGLARGYLHRPELTAERFVPDPWSREPGGRLYRTGDLARRRFDGAMEFLGRVDTQVKIRGFRIEPGEVEAVLAGCPGVRECAVLVHRDAPGGARLVAYVVATGGEPLRDGSVRAYLQQALPEYMVPAAYRFLEALPLTPNGKVDRAALPAVAAWEEPGVEESYVASRSPSESLLAGIWEELLGRERVGVEDDFFALGGHSLLATQVASRVRRAFGVELPLGSLFERTTIADLAAELDSRLRGDAVDPLHTIPPLQPVERGRDLPLSFAQQRLWFIDQIEPGNPTYNVPMAIALHGALTVEPLRRAFGEVVRRHEVLRTGFALGPDGPVQVIAPPWAVPLPVVSLAGLPVGERQAEALRLAAAEARHRFDLQSGPLLRLLLVRLAGAEGGEHVLLVTVHHVAADGWSLQVLLREVVALYGAFQHDEPSPLPELPIQYADFAVWQREWLSGEVFAAQLSYWREQLAEVPRRLELPTDRPRPLAPSHRGGVRPILLDASLSR
ncbi:MAG TPA: amino acid adenylation domain-containing protein, partial [Thermoanaerobaculia bacterium]|nr:amino acid adenylation domain-containing protein [Thermoanaerobaculia bacterium]